MQYGQPSVIWRIVRILSGLAVLTALIWVIVWAIFFRDNGKPAQTATTKDNSSQSTSNKPKSITPSPSSSKPAPSSTGGQSQNQTQPSSPSSTSQNNTSKPSQSQPAVAKPLADTGPGDVLAVFVGSSLLGIIGYHLRLRRRLASTI